MWRLAGVPEQARAAVAALSAAGMPAAVSGDVAADLLAPWRRPGRAVVYADPSDRPVHDELTAAGLRPSGAGEATLELIVAGRSRRVAGTWHERCRG